MLDVDKASTLPPVCYTTEEFLEFERRALFDHEWLCVGRVDRVANPGDYFTKTVNGERLIIARAKDGVIHAFSAICQHRGMQIVDDCGSCGTFTCPYHQWIYGLDGRLLGAPAMERTAGFVKSEWGLPNVRVEQWLGFLFVNFDADADPLAPSLARYEPFLEHYDLANSVSPDSFTLTDLPWNWKVMFENFNDGYHANRLHHTIQDFCPSNLAAFPVPWDDRSNVIFRTNGYTHIDGGFNATTKALLPVFPDLTEEERWRSTFALVPPSLCLGTAPDQAFYFIVTPEDRGDDRCRDRLPPASQRRGASDVRTSLCHERRRGASVRTTGPGRHHEGATGHAFPVRRPWAVLVAGREPRAVQPLARAALSQALAEPRSSVTEPLTTLGRITEAAHAHPDRPCLIVGDEALDHGEVGRLSAVVACRLRRSGLGEGSRIAVLSPNHLLVMVATLGTLRSGATWIPLNPRDSVDAIAELCRRFQVNALIHHSDFAGSVEAIRATAPTVDHTFLLDDVIAGHDVSVELTEPAPDALAAVFATGGTTGIAKGVCYSHRTLSAIVGNYVAMIDQPWPVFLAAGPLTHVSGRATLGVIATGGTTVVLPHFDAGAALAAIEQHRVTTTVLPATMLTRLLSHPAVSTTDMSSLRRVWVGASPVPVDLLKRAITVFGPVVTQNYGQTEAPMYIASMQPDDYLVDGRFVPDSRLASCGRATPFCAVRLIADDGTEVATGEVGEIVVRGDFVMDGYLDDATATAATKIDGYHRTGDLGRLDADGYLTIVGRLRQVVITGGFNVYPAEIEGVLAERPEVYESAVIGLPDPDWGERVVAVIELTEGAIYDPDDLRRFLRARLGGVKAPKELVVVDALPRNANGKILKNALIEQLTA